MGRNGGKARHRKIEFDLVFTYPKKWRAPRCQRKANGHTTTTFDYSKIARNNKFFKKITYNIIEMLDSITLSTP